MSIQTTVAEEFPALEFPPVAKKPGQPFGDPDQPLAAGQPLAPGQALGNKLFYLPTRGAPNTPATWNFDFQEVEITSKDGTQLHGWWIESKQQPVLGTVVFSHGTAGSIGHHLGFILWMAKSGYDILIYDYRGYGKSQGKTDRVGMIQDVSAALEFADTHRKIRNQPVISYGHSLGGAKSVAAIAEAKSPNLRAVVTDATFASYREMAAVLGGRLAAGIVSDELSPVDQIAKISPLPLLIIHGKKDPVVPFAQGQKLFNAAAKPKTMFEVQEGHHGDSLVRDKGAYRKRMLLWLDEQLKP